jgi:hypothetical protein
MKTEHIRILALDKERVKNAMERHNAKNEKKITLANARL